MRSLWITAVVLAVSLALGCAPKKRAQRSYPPVAGRTPTLVFDSRTMQEIRAERPTDELAVAWYEERLDDGPVAFRGYESPQLQAKSVWTTDQQLIIDGRVHTHFRQFSRHIEIQERVR